MDENGAPPKTSSVNGDAAVQTPPAHATCSCADSATTAAWQSPNLSTPLRPGPWAPAPCPHTSCTDRQVDGPFLPPNRQTKLNKDLTPLRTQVDSVLHPEPSDLCCGSRPPPGDTQNTTAGATCVKLLEKKGWDFIII